VGRLGPECLAVLGAAHAGEHQEAPLVGQVQRGVAADAWVGDVCVCVCEGYRDEWP